MGGSESKDSNVQIVDELVATAEAGDNTRLQEVLSSGLPINAPGSKGYSALIGALRNNQTDTLNILLALDSIDVNSRVVDTGKTALMFACEQHRNDIVLDLAVKKAKLDERDIDCQWSALHYAAYNNNVDALKILVEGGADINIVDCSNQSALHVACYTGYGTAARYLLVNGIDFNMLDNEGLEAIQLAESEEMRDLVLYYSNNSDGNQNSAAIV